MDYETCNNLKMIKDVCVCVCVFSNFFVLFQLPRLKGEKLCAG